MEQEPKEEEIKEGESEDFDGDQEDGIFNDKEDDGSWDDDPKNEKLDLELELGSRGKGGYTEFDDQL